MILALDVGNTNVRVAVVRGEDITSVRRLPTSALASVDDFESGLDSLLAAEGIPPTEVEAMALVSVVPYVSELIRESATRRGIDLFEANEVTVPIAQRLEAAATVGHDRLVNAFAAARLHGTPQIVVDLGTATTVDAVDWTGAFLGGAIAPGLGLGLDALASRTAQLPRVRIELPRRAIGRRTVEALQSGAVLGHVGMVDYLVRAMGAELAALGSPKPRLILTGGLSELPWVAAIPGVDAIDPLLTLRGLAILHAEATRPQSVTT